MSFPAFLYHPAEAPTGRLFKTDPCFAEDSGWVDTPDKFPTNPSAANDGDNIVWGTSTNDVSMDGSPVAEVVSDPDPGDVTDAPKKRGRKKKDAE